MSELGGAMGIQAKGLCVVRGGKRVLQGLSLAVPPGQWLAVVGPNGAGKSTLLASLAGLLPLQSGQLGWQSAEATDPAPSASPQALHPWPRGAQRGRMLAWLGQDPLADEALSVRDTVALGRLPHHGWLGWGRWSQADEAATQQALADTDMAWAQALPLSRLSGGERQRVALARALAVQAPVLLLDEPVAHLDAPHQRLVARVLRREASRGRCIISVLHELPLALMADRIVVMQALAPSQVSSSSQAGRAGQQGQIVADGLQADPALHRAIEAVFDHAVRITQHEGRWVALPQV